MPQMAGMHDVEHAVTHDDLALARRRTDDRRYFRGRLDLVLEMAAERFHGFRPPAPDTQTMSWLRPRSIADPKAARRATVRYPPSCDVRPDRTEPRASSRDRAEFCRCPPRCSQAPPDASEYRRPNRREARPDD